METVLAGILIDVFGISKSRFMFTSGKLILAINMTENVISNHKTANQCLSDRHAICFESSQKGNNEEQPVDACVKEMLLIPDSGSSLQCQNIYCQKKRVLM